MLEARTLCEELLLMHVSHPGHKQQVLLMTCRVRVIGMNACTCEVRVLLDPASTVSLVMEKLAQSLCLRRQHSTTRVSGVGGGLATASARGLVQVELKSIGEHEKGRLRVDAL